MDTTNHLLAFLTMMVTCASCFADTYAMPPPPEIEWVEIDERMSIDGDTITLFFQDGYLPLNQTDQVTHHRSISYELESGQSFGKRLALRVGWEIHISNEDETVLLGDEFVARSNDFNGDLTIVQFQHRAYMQHGCFADYQATPPQSAFSLTKSHTLHDDTNGILKTSDYTPPTWTWNALTNEQGMYVATVHTTPTEMMVSQLQYATCGLVLTNLNWTPPTRFERLLSDINYLQRRVNLRVTGPTTYPEELRAILTAIFAGCILIPLSLRAIRARR